MPQNPHLPAALRPVGSPVRLPLTPPPEPPSAPNREKLRRISGDSSPSATLRASAEGSGVIQTRSRMVMWSQNPHLPAAAPAGLLSRKKNGRGRSRTQRGLSHDKVVEANNELRGTAGSRELCVRRCTSPGDTAHGAAYADLPSDKGRLGNRTKSVGGLEDGGGDRHCYLEAFAVSDYA
jgi:hypothetical protein